jgi:hypothetical protein
MPTRPSELSHLLRQPAAGTWRCAFCALLIVFYALRAAAAAEADLDALTHQPHAGIVRVTAGEHGQFSRIVFAVGTDPRYRTEPRPEGLLIQFPGASFEFDFSAASIEARTRRVIAARSGDSGEGATFDLSFNCTCTTKTFVHEGKVVVDVFDPSRDERPQEAANRIDERRTSATPAGEQAVPTATLGHGAVARDDTVDQGKQDLPRPEFVRRVEQLAGLPGPIELPQPQPGQAPFDREHLRNMMAWAIDQGHLIAAHAADPPTGAERASPRARERDAPDGAVSRAHEIDAPERPAARREDSSGAPVSEPVVAEKRVQVQCPQNAVLDAPARIGAGPFATELARRQDALSTALSSGEGAAEAQLALAAFYLARLMPDEALASLAGLEPSVLDQPDAVWLKAAALLLADRADEIGPADWRRSTCGGRDIALWRAAIVAGLGEPALELLAPEGIVRRLTAYPLPLRIELGLRLAQAGLDARAAKDAERFLAIVEAAGPGEQALARVLFLKGRLAALRGDFAGAHTHWQQAVRLPGEYGVRAKLALLRALLDAGKQVAADEWPLLERFAFDWRGHDLQLEIARLSARLYEREGQPLLALRMLEGVALSAPGRSQGLAAARLATNLLRRLYSEAPTASGPAQLGAFWRYEGFVPPGPDGADIRLAFARALVGHDLPEAAVAILKDLSTGAPTAIAAEATTLLAEAHLLLGQAELALALLGSEAGRLPEPQPARDVVAARALAQLGRFAEAAGVLHERTTAEAMMLKADYLWNAALWSEAMPAHLQLLDRAREAGDEATTRRLASRAAAAAYMAGGAEALGRAHDEGMSAISASGETSARMALLDEVPPEAGTRARASILLEQALRLAEFARAQ